MPESCTDSGTPSQGTFSLTFGVSNSINLVIGGATNTYLSNSCTVIFPNPPGGTEATTYSTNTVTVIMPSQP